MEDFSIINKKNKLKSKRHLPPSTIIVLGFLLIILAGSLVLMLPISQRQRLSYFDVLFTATSAVCVTGLTTVNVAASFTVFGQVVIMILMQIGGLGIMTITTLVFIFFGKKITLKDRLALSESFNDDKLQGLVKITLAIIKFTVIIEGAGTVLLAFAFVPEYGFFKGIYYSTFHSVAAFCNSGLDVLGVSFTNYQSNILVNLSLMSLIFLGGIGFAVINEVVTKKKQSKISLNAKVVIITSVVLIAVSALLFAFTEWNNQQTIASESLSTKILSVFFQAITARTAGFNTFNQQQMTDASKLITIINMFIGASPASTGGGIKTTTIFALFALFVTGIKGSGKEVSIFGKSIPYKAVLKAVLLLIYSLTVITVFTIAISMIESNNSQIRIDAVLFEVVSAISTVGLSLNLTAKLSVPSQALIIVLMFIGRLGTLMLSLLFLQRKQYESYIIKYPEAKLIIG